MKKLHYILLAALCTVMAACMDGDWDEPIFTQAPYGNNAINEENIISIAQLKADPDYASAFSNDKNKKVEKDVKLRGRVSGNDIGGNLYKQFALQDETGGIIVAVNEGGLNGYLAEGQEIIVDLKGLYVGGYGGMPEIGTPYNGGIGRMSKDIWATHFKIIGGSENIKPEAIQPVDFATIVNDMDQAGILVTLKNVHFSAANGKRTLVDGAASGGSFFSQQLKEYGSKVIIRTSSYADFAAMVMPSTGCNITGIATRYRTTWQILIRKTSDIEILDK
ncbi:MAG: hypothetical protein IJ892_01985 [Prevotella sp.]|nr:hypothetical protein [Prevotella sp.]